MRSKIEKGWSEDECVVFQNHQELLLFDMATEETASEVCAEENLGVLLSKIHHG